MLTKKSPKIFLCSICNYETCKKSEYVRHENTRKHINANKKNAENAEIVTDEIKSFVCLDCNSIFRHASSLSRHLKSCKQKNEVINKNKENDNITSLVMEIIKSNYDLQKQNCQLQQQNLELQKQTQHFQEKVLDVCKNIQPNITNTHTNSHNKTFNLQFFLNEQCKDAMNISDFIKSVSLSIQDLERVGTLGYVEGISSIIINELRNLDIHKRPMHCSDTKRETLYIKDEDKWEKEDHENKKIKNVIKSVEHKNIKMINEWTKEHSAYKASHDKDNDKYLNIVLEAAGGIGDYEEKGNKIIKKIAKEVAIDK